MNLEEAHNKAKTLADKLKAKLKEKGENDVPVVLIEKGDADKPGYVKKLGNDVHGKDQFYLMVKKNPIDTTQFDVCIVYSYKYAENEMSYSPSPQPVNTEHFSLDEVVNSILLTSDDSPKSSPHQEGHKTSSQRTPDTTMRTQISPAPESVVAPPQNVRQRNEKELLTLAVLNYLGISEHPTKLGGPTDYPNSNPSIIQESGNIYLTTERRDFSGRLTGSYSDPTSALRKAGITVESESFDDTWHLQGEAGGDYGKYIRVSYAEIERYAKQHGISVEGTSPTSDRKRQAVTPPKPPETPHTPKDRQNVSSSSIRMKNEKELLTLAVLNYLGISEHPTKLGGPTEYPNSNPSIIQESGNIYLTTERRDFSGRLTGSYSDPTSALRKAGITVESESFDDTWHLQGEAGGDYGKYIRVSYAEIERYAKQHGISVDGTSPTSDKKRQAVTPPKPPETPHTPKDRQNVSSSSIRMKNEKELLTLAVLNYLGISEHPTKLGGPTEYPNSNPSIIQESGNIYLTTERRDFSGRLTGSYSDPTSALRKAGITVESESFDDTWHLQGEAGGDYGKYIRVSYAEIERYAKQHGISVDGTSPTSDKKRQAVAPPKPPETPHTPKDRQNVSSSSSGVLKTLQGSPAPTTVASKRALFENPDPSVSKSAPPALPPRKTPPAAAAKTSSPSNVLQQSNQHSGNYTERSDYFGKISRQAAEEKLSADNSYLLRDSVNSPFLIISYKKGDSIYHDTFEIPKDENLGRAIDDFLNRNKNLKQAERSEASDLTGPSSTRPRN